MYSPTLLETQHSYKRFVKNRLLTPSTSRCTDFDHWLQHSRPFAMSQPIDTEGVENAAAVFATKYHPLVLPWKTIVGQHYNNNPGTYLKRAQEENREQYNRAKRIRSGINTKSKRSITTASSKVDSTDTGRSTTPESPLLGSRSPENYSYINFRGRLARDTILH